MYGVMLGQERRLVLVAATWQGVFNMSRVASEEKAGVEPAF